jgi:hypothetical protein
MPTLGLNPSRSSIINPKSIVGIDYCIGLAGNKALGFPNRPPTPPLLPSYFTA